MSKRDAVLAGAVVAALVALAAAPALAGFAGTDLFLPMAGRQAGVHPSNWYTTAWIHNPGPDTATARVFFLERNTANPAPPWVDVLVAPGDTEMLENVVETYFHRQAFGALRVTCDTQRLVVTSRVFSQAAGADARDSVGQDFAAVPAAFAIGAGERTQVLGLHQTDPDAADSDFRSNFGFVETTGHSVTVRVRALDGAGAQLGEPRDISVREYSQRQLAFKDYFPPTSENVRLDIEVASGAGRVIAYASSIANGSQDPTTLEMQYSDTLLGAGTITGVTAGDGLTGGGVDGAVSLAVGAGDGINVAADTVSLADGGVTTAKLAAAAVTPDRVAPSATVGQVLTTVAAGAGSPVETMSLAGNAVAWQTPATSGDITEVTAGTGLDGGATEGAASLSVEVPLVLSGNNESATPGDWRGIVKGVNGALFGGGVVGQNLGEGPGVIGVSSRGSGVWGTSDDSDGTGVSGTAFGGPSARGISGQSTAGTAVHATATSGTGVYAAATTGTGVYAESALGVGIDVRATRLALHAKAEGSNAIRAIVGEMPEVMLWGDIAVIAYASAGTGVMATGLGPLGSGVRGEGTNHGVHGVSEAGTGTSGRSDTGRGVEGWTGKAGYSGTLPASAGVVGSSQVQTGVWGGSNSGYGVHGSSSSSDGVFGESSGSASDAGVYGTHHGAGRGVEGLCNAGYGVYGRTANGTGVRGYASDAVGYAGYFLGKTHVNGALSKSSGSFRIDHPLDPANKYLSHSFVESPDMMNVYNGNVVTDSSGEAVVELPEWFEALNRDFRYQLTVIGEFAQAIVATKVAGNRFTIRTDKPNIEVSWQVTGIRQDPWAREHPIVVEEVKPEGDRGHYLHPELYGLDETASTDAMTRAEAAMADRAAEAVSQAEPR